MIESRDQNESCCLTSDSYLAAFVNRIYSLLINLKPESDMDRIVQTDKEGCSI